MKSGHCSIRQLAKHLGLAPSTVSMALNGHPSIAQKTRKRVEAAARELGYRPNALLSAMMSPKRSDETSPRFRDVPIAMVRDISPEQELEPPSYHGIGFMRVFEKEAQAHGFACREFNLADFKHPAELDRILFNRGYRAILVGPWIGERPRVLEMDLSRYTVVGLGDLACDLPLLSIRMNMTASVRLVWEKLTALSVRRVLFAVRLEPQPGRKDYETIGAIDALRRLAAPSWEMRLHIGRQGSDEKRQFQQCVKEWKPDVCVGYNQFHYHALREMGVSVPQDMRYAELHAETFETAHPSGVLAPHAAIARRALAETERLLRSGTFGIDPAMGEILLEPEWVEGETLS